MRVVICALAAAALGVAGSPQDGGKAPVDRQEVACDLKTIATGKLCETCNQLLDEEKIDDRGRCRKCERLPRDVELCVKSIFRCGVCGKRTLEQGDC